MDIVEECFGSPEREKKNNEQTQNNRGWPASFLVDRI